ncbi:MAG: hypothetical protein U0470_13835 [Anaerolineae bacterium]
MLAVTPPGAVADEVRALLARAEGGADSNRLLAAAAALSAGDYDAAQAAAAVAKARAADVGADGIAGGATELGTRAAAGQRAALDEARAARLPRWRVFEARRAAAAAAAAPASATTRPRRDRARCSTGSIDASSPSLGSACWPAPSCWATPSVGEGASRGPPAADRRGAPRPAVRRAAARALAERR